MAVTVPYDPVPKVEPRIAPTPYDRTHVPKGAFGDYTAEAMQHLGSTLRQTGMEMFERAMAMQAMDDRAAADEAVSGFQMQSAVQHNDMLMKTGKEAADSLVPTLQGIEKTRQDFRAGLGSRYAQQLYDSETRRMQGSLLSSASRHAATEHKAYIVNSLTAKSVAANNTALSVPQDDDAFNASLAEKDRIADQMMEQGVFKGGQEERDIWATTQKSTLTANRIILMAQSDPFAAGKVAGEAITNKTLVGADQAKVMQHVQSLQNTIGSRVETERIMSGEGSVAGGGPVNIDRAAKTVGQQLSKDNYEFIGRTESGDRGLGRYRVPAKELSARLKEAGMDDMSEEDFLKSHQAQDKLFTTLFGRYQNETGSFNDAFFKWTGRKPVEISGGMGTSEQRSAFDTFRAMGWSKSFAHAMIATLSGESGSRLNPRANQTTGDGGRDWTHRFKTSGAGHGVANWNDDRADNMVSWAVKQGLDPNQRSTQLKFIDYEVRQYGFDPTKEGDPRALTVALTGSTASGTGYERPKFNNGADRWAKYSGGRYSGDPEVQQVNGLLARNTPVDEMVEAGRRRAAEIAPNNPLFAEYMTERILHQYRIQEMQQKIDESENKRVVEDALNPDEKGHVPVSEEELRKDPDVATAFDHSSPAEQQRIRRALDANANAGGVVATDESRRLFHELHAAQVDPDATPEQRQKLLDTDISSLENMPLKERYILNSDKRKVEKREEAPPNMKRAMQVLAPTLDAIHLDKSDPERWNSFVSQLSDAIQQYHKDFAKPPSNDEIQQMGSRLLREQPQGKLKSFFFSPSRWFEMPVPPEAEEAIKADPRWVERGIEPTDKAVRDIYVMRQFHEAYEKQRSRK